MVYWFTHWFAPLMFTMFSFVLYIMYSVELIFAPLFMFWFTTFMFATLTFALWFAPDLVPFVSWNVLWFVLSFALKSVAHFNEQKK